MSSISVLLCWLRYGHFDSNHAYYTFGLMWVLISFGYFRFFFSCSIKILLIPLFAVVTLGIKVHWVATLVTFVFKFGLALAIHFRMAHYFCSWYRCVGIIKHFMRCFAALYLKSMAKNRIPRGNFVNYSAFISWLKGTFNGHLKLIFNKSHFLQWIFKILDGSWKQPNSILLILSYNWFRAQLS